MDKATGDRLQILLERQDILDCMNRFSRGMDRFDREVFLSAFHSDAIISAGDFVGGPIALYDWACAMHEQGQKATHHNLLNHNCELGHDPAVGDADVYNLAHCETYYLFVARNRDDSNWMAGGRYIDRVEKRNGAWKIAFRSNAIEWSGMVPTMALPFADVADLFDNGAPSRSKTDPS